MLELVLLLLHRSFYPAQYCFIITKTLDRLLCFNFPNEFLVRLDLAQFG